MDMPQPAARGLPHFPRLQEARTDPKAAVHDPSQALVMGRRFGFTPSHLSRPSTNHGNGGRPSANGFQGETSPLL